MFFSFLLPQVLRAYSETDKMSDSTVVTIRSMLQSLRWTFSNGSTTHGAQHIHFRKGCSFKLQVSESNHPRRTTLHFRKGLLVQAMGGQRGSTKPAI